jgi:AraC-like DNA-binding protein
MTINEFVLAVKLNRAKELLKSSEMPISEIAKSCGWESESYFYRFFRGRTGKTPLQYRKSHIIR